MSYFADNAPVIDRAQQQQTWQQAWQYYAGHPPRPLVPRRGEPDDNLIFSFARLIVNKGVSYLFGQPVTTKVADDHADNTKPPKPGPAQLYLDEVWRRNKRQTLLKKCAINGGVTGHVFLRVYNERPFPRIIHLATNNVDVVWKDDDYEDVLEYQIDTGTVEDAQTRQRITRQDNGTWHIVDQQMLGGGGVWEDVGAPEVWPYDFPPISECQNLIKPNSYWGESDLTDDVIHILKAINTQASHLNKILRVHGYPKLWARGMGNKTIRQGIDEVIMLPSDSAELNAIQVKPDIAAALDCLNLTINVGCWITSVPKVSFGDPDGLGAVSGVSMQLRFAPLVEKTEDKRTTYGEMLVELDRRLCVLHGLGDHVLTTLHWPELLPTDPLQERQVAVIDDSLGVSTETILEKLGYNPELEAQRKAYEQSQAPISIVLPDQQGTASDGLPPQQNSLDGSVQPAIPTIGKARLPGVPPPAPLQAPIPDIARTGRSR